jgi:hypothetical protein
MVIQTKQNVHIWTKELYNLLVIPAYSKLTWKSFLAR